MVNKSFSGFSSGFALGSKPLGDFPKLSLSPKNIKNNFLKKNNLKMVLGDQGLRALDKIRTQLVLDLLAGGGKVGHGFIEMGVRSILNSMSPTVPFTEGLSSMTSESSSTTKYVQTFVCGKPSSKAVRNVMKQNGSEIIRLYDSLSDVGIGARKNLNFNFGFNQKKYVFLGKNSHVSLKDYFDTYNLQKYVFPKFMLKTPYGMAISEHVKLKVINHNRYNAVNFNLHLVCLKDYKLAMEDLARGTFNNTTTLQDDGAIPCIYQYSDLVTGSTKSEILCNVTTNLLSSAKFKNQCKIVKSFKQRLNPGDIYEFLYKYRCGSGVRLDLLNDRIVATKSADQPSTYGFIIEALGYDCEAIDVEDETMRYIGKSPGFFNIEVSKHLEVCTQSELVTTSTDVNFDSDKKDYAIRIYSKALKKEKDFNFDYTQLDKKYKIITYSIENVRSAGEASFSKPIEKERNFVEPKKDITLLEDLGELNDEDLF